MLLLLLLRYIRKWTYVVLSLSHILYPTRLTLHFAQLALVEENLWNVFHKQIEKYLFLEKLEKENTVPVTFVVTDSQWKRREYCDAENMIAVVVWAEENPARRDIMENYVITDVAWTHDQSTLSNVNQHWPEYPSSE